MLSDFWNRVSQILILAAPALLMLIGIDIIPIVDNLNELFTIYLPAIFVIAKDIIQIVRGWFAASRAGNSFIEYTRLKPYTIYTFLEHRSK